MKWKRWMILTAVSGAIACSGATTPNNDDPNNGTVNNGENNNANNGSNNGAASYEGLVVNEIVASGDPDWFEFFNAGDAVIDLTGVTYSDDLGTPAGGSFADGTTLAPGEYIALDASDETTGFKLGGDEALGIFAPNGEVIDSVDWEEGDAPDTASFGRFPNGTGDFKTLYMPTRQAENVDNEGPLPECGNDTIEAGEVCDGTDLGDASCEAEGFSGGTVSCQADCLAIDTTSCDSATGALVINETQSSGDDQIELLNTGDAELDLTGWYVSDDSYDPMDETTNDKRFDLTGSLAAGAYLVLVKDTDHTFGLGGDDAVILYNPAGEIVDQADWLDGEAEPSFCRLPDGTGEFQTCTTETWGTENME